MKLFRKPKSKFYWYDFTVRGHRYRVSTQETKPVRAFQAASLKLASALENSETAMYYQHPELETVRAALDYRPPTTEAAA